MADPLSVGIVAAAAAYVGKPAAEEFLKKISGPLASEIGEAVAQPLREWRARRAAAAIAGAKQMLDDCGITPQPISPKLLVPLAEAASLEDEDELTIRWAALLANAAAGSRGAPVHPRFPSVLQQMTARDAFTLEYLGTGAHIHAALAGESNLGDQHPYYSPPPDAAEVGILISLGLVEKESVLREAEQGVFELIDPKEANLRLTEFGRAFLGAVSRPER